MSENCHVCDDLYNFIDEAQKTLQCPSCSHIYRICPEDNHLYHQEKYRTDSRFFRATDEYNEDGSVNENFHNARNKIVTSRKEKIAQYLSPEYSLLDIGAGAGTFSQEIRDSVKEIECNEIADVLADECERLGFKTYRGDILGLDLGRTYDVVSAWHVLEHVEDIQEFRDLLVNLTTKYCIIEVPLLSSMDPNEHKIRHLHSPTLENWDGHSHYFSPASLREFFEDDFKILSFEVGVQDPAVLCIMEKR